MLDRIKSSEETYKVQKEYIDKNIKYKFSIISDPDKLFWTSMIISDVDKHRYKITAGKGNTYFDCLASNCGELIERYSWNKWLEDNSFQVKDLELKNLITGDIDLIDVNNLIKYEDRSDYIASGNNEQEAILHVLNEAYEYGFLRNNYSHTPINFFTVDTENIIPEFPKKVHDSFSVLVRMDPRFKMYDVTAFKKPDKYVTEYMPDYITKIDNRIQLNNIVSHFSPAVGDVINKDPWPPFAGTRAGLDLKETIKSAMTEMVQNHYLMKMSGYIDHDIIFEEGEKTNNSLYNKSTGFNNYSKGSIEENIKFILKQIEENGFGAWMINITPEDCPIQTVKIITDYSIGKQNPYSKKIMSRFFNI